MRKLRAVMDHNAMLKERTTKDAAVCIDALSVRTLFTHSRASIEPSRARHGMPRTAEEWTALVKVGSGESNISAVYFERLFALGLVERKSGLPILTHYGRVTLGLPD